MTHPSTHRPLLLIQAAGFVLVLMAIWADELLDIPGWIFHAPESPPRWAEIWFETAVIGALAVVALGVSARLLREVRELRSMVAVCAWCRRVRVDGQWVPFEQFLLSEQKRPTHGVCDRCMAAMEEEG